MFSSILVCLFFNYSFLTVLYKTDIRLSFSTKASLWGGCWLAEGGELKRECLIAVIEGE
jgi:hypothetical protein